MTENSVHEISIEIDEKIKVMGKKYYDESTKYLITSEETLKNPSEGRLLQDIVYLLTKIRLLEDKLRETINERENLVYNSRVTQTTIDEQFCGLDSVEVK